MEQVKGSLSRTFNLSCSNVVGPENTQELIITGEGGRQLSQKFLEASANMNTTSWKWWATNRQRSVDPERKPQIQRSSSYPSLVDLRICTPRTLQQGI